ncbi:MAG: hypothetical protein HRT40_11535, partial [Campylobacteraceae bacterium]|nr:hypothetical protein [Campylobacteraceae bacterium]
MKYVNFLAIKVLNSILLLTLIGCGSSSKNENKSPSKKETQVTVERGPVYGALVKDVNGKIATASDTENIYTFTGTPAYPITVTNGWIDVDGDKQLSSKDISLNIVMKSYTNNVTPVTTYLANGNQSLREKKLNDLLLIANENSNKKITKDDLLKPASISSKEVQMLINSVYAQIIEEKSSDFEVSAIMENLNEFKNLNLDSSLSAKKSAEFYENYLINESSIKEKFVSSKITNDEINNYKMPVLNIKTINKDEQIVVIINNFPLASLEYVRKTFKDLYEE